MILNSVVDENTIVYEHCMIYTIGISKIIHNKELKWHDSGEFNYLTLKEIKEQLNGLPIRIINDNGLNGEIYEYGNYNDGKWYLYGITKGYA